jgi:acyl-CoA thioesterase-1
MTDLLDQLSVYARPTLLVVELLALSGVLVYRYMFGKIMRLPRNNPKAVLAAGKKVAMNKPYWVCLGDSHTHATVAASFVEILERGTLGGRFSFVNAGINGDLAYNMLKRLDDVLALRPAVVSILAGSNDMKAFVHKSLAEGSTRDKGPFPAGVTLPSEEFYASSLSSIVSAIRTALPETKILLVELPPLGEGGEQAIIKRGNAIVRKVVSDNSVQKVKLVPIFDALCDAAKELRAKAGLRPERKMPDVNLMSAIIIASARHYFLFQDWDTVGKKMGWTVLTEGLHLNEVACKIIAQAIEKAFASM